MLGAGNGEGRAPFTAEAYVIFSATISEQEVDIAEAGDTTTTGSGTGQRWGVVCMFVAVELIEMAETTSIATDSTDGEAVTCCNRNGAR